MEMGSPAKQFCFLMFLALFFGVGFTVNGHAKPKYDPAIFERYTKFYNAGNYQAALVEAHRFQSAMKAMWGTNHWAYASALEIIANIYSSLDQYAKAEHLYNQALRILETTKGPQNKLYAAETLEPRPRVRIAIPAQ
jgi:tetratricopeptide (TPR) repeat protein